jgi:hypothetical protein
VTDGDIDRGCGAMVVVPMMVWARLELSQTCSNYASRVFRKRIPGPVDPMTIFS